MYTIEDSGAHRDSSQVVSEKDFQEVDKLYRSLVHYSSYGAETRIVGTGICPISNRPKGIPASFTGMLEDLGNGSRFFNSGSSAMQFLAVLSLRRAVLIGVLDECGIDLVSKEKKIFVDHKPIMFIHELYRKKILSGLRILDLGCGYEPAFARVSRYLGASVFTVDVIPSVTFKFNSHLFPEKQRGIESESHVQLDLNVPDAVERLRGATKGQLFHVVTQAHIGGKGLI